MLYNKDTQTDDTPQQQTEDICSKEPLTAPVAPPSIKKMLIISVLELLGNQSLQNKKIILLTAAGTIKGRINIQENPDEAFDSPLWALTQAVNRSYEQYCPDSPLPGNDGYMLLKDVVIEQAGKTTELEHMIVFFDQIIAVSTETI